MKYQLFVRKALLQFVHRNMHQENLSFWHLLSILLGFVGSLYTIFYHKKIRPVREHRAEMLEKIRKKGKVYMEIISQNKSNVIAPIKVDMNRGTASARELHEALQIETPFRKWFPRMCEYGFFENVDYTPDTFVHPQNGQETMDYNINIDMAKQICMIQRTEKGKQCRQYFIDLEKAWNTPEQVMARALKVAADTQNHLLETIENQNIKIEQMRPKEIFADAVSTSKTSILIGELAKLICQNGYSIGQNRLFDWLREKGYLMREGASRNIPKQKYVEQGLFEVKETNIQNPDGSVRITKTTKVTGKGQIYFINKFLPEKGEAYAKGAN